MKSLTWQDNVYQNEECDLVGNLCIVSNYFRFWAIMLSFRQWISKANRKVKKWPPLLMTIIQMQKLNITMTISWKKTQRITINTTVELKLLTRLKTDETWFLAYRFPRAP